jgi:hypothetical protein
MKRTWMLWIAVAAMLVVVPVALAADGGGKAHAKGTGVFGELTAVGEKEITVAVRAKEKGAAPESKTLAVTADTKVKIQKAPAAEGEKPKAEDGKVGDLKVGQRVMVKCSEDGKTALEILVPVPGAHKGGERGKKEAPK